ncbi:MAG TPA: hypothetical protein VKU61_15370 [Candidatus Binatia bacterium]|nr:hypothetical protein [Candidatus Binatia bacterium]
MARATLAVAALLLVVGPMGARATICVEGTAIGCDDGDPCTIDRCVGFHCQHQPATGPACNDRDPCTQDDRCDAGRCVGTPVVCPDDGFSCTDEACVGGHCESIPIDARCVPINACASATCSPQQSGHDAAGCTPGPARTDGEECAEDGDACTDDVCAGARCTHPAVFADRASCVAVQAAFQLALALEGDARAMLATAAVASVAARVDTIRSGLDRVARALAGKETSPRATPGRLADTPGRARARLALAILRSVNVQVGALRRTVALPSVRAAVGGGADVATHVRALARGVRALRAELRRLLRVRGFFVP